KNALIIKDAILNSNLSNSANNSVDFYDIDSLFDKGKTWLTKDRLQDFKFFSKLKDESLNSIFDKLKSDIKEYFINHEEYILSKIFRLFSKYVAFKKEYKKSIQEFDFKDVTNLAYQLFSSYEDRDFIYFRLDSEFLHLLVDEFQDTSIIQYKILKPIIDEIISGYGRADFRTFFYVGDTKQSIYRFRGGHKELFDYVFDEYKNFGIVEQKLDSNYRSKKNIVNFVNDCFRDLIENYFDQKCENIGGFIEVVECEKEHLQTLALDKLKMLLDLNIEAENIAILGFKNDELFELAEFIKEQLPHIDIVTETTKKLIHQQNIQAVINYAKYIYFHEELYKCNFLALIGKDFTNSDLENIKYSDLLDLMYKIAKKYNLIDEDMLLFFEVISKYKDIDEFVYNIDYLDESIVKKHQKGLKLLTIHKSKGLEFEHVILLDKLGSKNSRKSPFVFDYEGINLKSIKYRFKLRDSFDIDYKKALENEEKKESEDLKHLLYVAFTRAKESLIVIKKDKQSEFELLNLPQMQIGNLNISQTTVKHKQKIEIDKIKLKRYGLQEDFVTLKKDEILDYKAINFGIAMHYTLEILSTFSMESLENAIKSTYNRFGNLLSQDEFSDIKNRVSMLLENQLFQKMLDGKVYKEQPISYMGELKQLDLFIEKESEIIVCDYKSATFRQKEYKNQVLEYSKALNDIFKKPTIGFLIFLHKDSVEIKEICKIGYS
ncbi:MAG: RecB-like helicase, partial [Campylobacterales bacterium]|nr:RecB-like helicase [Campylobacterales bacterium]